MSRRQHLLLLLGGHALFVVGWVIIMLAGGLAAIGFVGTDRSYVASPAGEIGSLCALGGLVMALMGAIAEPR